MKSGIFGREPTLWVAAINALIMVVGTLSLKELSTEQAGLLVIVVNAAFALVNAWAVRPISPVTFTYAIGAGVAFMTSYGLQLPPEFVSGMNLAVIPFLALLTRGQVTPADTPISRESTPKEVARETGTAEPQPPVE